MENSPANDSLKASLSPPVRCRLRLFRGDWQTEKYSNNVLNIFSNGYGIERMENIKFPGFYSHLFLIPKPPQRWRPVIDLSKLSTFLLVERFKMEMPESTGPLIPRE